MRASPKAFSWKLKLQMTLNVCHRAEQCFRIYPLHEHFRIFFASTQLDGMKTEVTRCKWMASCKQKISIKNYGKQWARVHNYIPPTGWRDGFSCVWSIDIPGTIIAGNVRERKSGGGVLCAQHFPVDVWAATAAAAALSWTKVKLLSKFWWKNA